MRLDDLLSDIERGGRRNLYSWLRSAQQYPLEIVA